MTMKPAELVADIDRRVRALERTRAALGGGGSGTFLPLAGGTMTGTLTGAGGTFTSLSVNGSTVTTASSLATELASYLPLTGGTLSGHLEFSSSAAKVRFTEGTGPAGLEFEDGSGNLEGALYYRSSPNSWAFENASGAKIAEFDTDDLRTTLAGQLNVHGPIELTDTGTLNLKGTDSSTNPNSLNFYSGSSFWHWSGPRTGESNEMHAYWYNGSSYTVALKLHTSGQVSTGGNLVVNGAATVSGQLTANGNISLRSANGVRDSIYRVGGIFFTWDSDSYGTNTHHSIRSTNGDTWGDSITINSFGNVRVNIDSNGNGTNTYTVGRHTTGTANTLLTLDESGNHTVTGRSRASVGSSSSPSFSFNGDTNTGIYRVANGQLGVSCNGTVHTFKNDGLHLASGDWFRSYGSAGWYSQTHGGGWYMIDTTWLRTYNDKPIYSGSGIIRTDSTGAFEMPNATTTWSYSSERSPR
jgi:hypothetical protein